MHRTISEDAVLTRRLLGAGVIAGPLFTATLLVQLALREGFDLTRHPLSLLALGDEGWVQVANFILAGVLSIGFAAGVRRALRPGRASAWGPLLLAVYGSGLVIAGIFTADPAFGFPPGAPAGMPQSFTVHGTVHAIAPPVAFSALITACLVLARRLRADGRPRWAAYSVFTAVVALFLVAPVPADAYSVRLALGIVVGWAWIGALAMLLRRDVRVAPNASIQSAPPAPVPQR